MATTKARATYLLVVWALVAADLFGTGLARASLAAVGKEQREFDYFALALQWPGTICASTHKCCAINGCCRYVPVPSLSPRSPSPPPPLVRVGWGFGRALRRFDFSPLRTRTDAARFLCSPLQGGAAPDVHDP
jgi:hypothetical protein